MAKSLVNFSAIIFRKQSRRERITGSQLGHQTRRRRVSQAEAFDKSFVDLTLFEHLARHRGLVRGQHLAKMGGGLFVDFKDLFPLFFPFLLCFIDTAGRFRDRNPSFIRDNPHRFGKTNVLDQLDKLEDIPTDTASEAVEELPRAGNIK